MRGGDKSRVGERGDNGFKGDVDSSRVKKEDDKRMAIPVMKGSGLCSLVSWYLSSTT